MVTNPASAEGVRDVVGYYVLDGVPLFLTREGFLVTVDGSAVDWGEWLYRARCLGREDYDRIVSQRRSRNERLGTA